MKESLPIQLDEPAEASMWFRKTPSQWYENLPTTGTILDLFFLLFFLPVLIWTFVFQKGTNTEDVLCVLSGNELLFFEGSKRKNSAELLVARFGKANLANLSFEKSHKTEVCFDFDGETAVYYFEGIYSDLVGFKNKILITNKGVGSKNSNEESNNENTIQDD